MTFRNPELKPLFVERMKKLLPIEKDFQNYLDILKIEPVRSIRCNTLKISPENLKKRLEEKGWKISQLWKTHPEIMIVENKLMPGELGRSLEHLLGYYYVQELASMLPIIALKPKPNETILDLCASPGSKTTQTASEMKNTGTIIANESNIGRLSILASNLERCGVTNTIITRKDGRDICKNLKESGIIFDKILVDAPCSGEGTLRSSKATYFMWNIKTIQNLPKIQEKLFSEAFELLKVRGEIIYSTCTHAPEENEGIVDSILKKFGNKIEILDVKKDLPIKVREGITSWNSSVMEKKNSSSEDWGASDFARNNSTPKAPRAGGREPSEITSKGEQFAEKSKIQIYDKRVKLCARIYPQDNNTEGFFIAKFKKIK